MVKDLRTYDTDKLAKNCSITKSTIGGFMKGGIKGAGFAGAVNTMFPSLIPTFAAMATGASEMSTISKIGIGLGLSSAPAIQLSGLGILGIGAAAGAILGGTISLIKAARYKKIAGEEISKKR